MGLLNTITARCEIHALILIRASGFTYRRLSSVNQSLWGCREFREGCAKIHDEEWTEGPLASDGIVGKVANTLLEDRRITIREPSVQVVEISNTTIHKTLNWPITRFVCAGSRGYSQKTRRMFFQQCAVLIIAFHVYRRLNVHHFVRDRKKTNTQMASLNLAEATNFKLTLLRKLCNHLLVQERAGQLLFILMPPGTTKNCDWYDDNVLREFSWTI